MKSKNNNNDDDDDDGNNNNTAMGSVHVRGDTFLTFGLKALTETNTSRLATALYLYYILCYDSEISNIMTRCMTLNFVRSLYNFVVSAEYILICHRQGSVLTGLREQDMCVIFILPLALIKLYFPITSLFYSI
jgi:hypothetical protein